MRLADGSRLLGVRPEMLLAAMAVESAFEQLDLGEAIVTGGIEGSHSRASLHYAGCALDFRTRHVPAEHQEELRNNVAGRLGDDFDVVLEATPPHLHVEFQPKNGYRG